jgi:parallel beta-helix repeat protein
MKVKKFFRNIAQYVPQTLVLLSVLTSNIFFPAVALAEEISNLQSTNTQVQDIPVDESEDILDEGISTSIYEEDEEYEPRFVYEDGIYTVNTVVEGEEYVYPDNQSVRIVFNEITEDGNLVIKRVELTDEEKELLNTSDDYGWDISSSMSNGSFSYDLTLPNTQGDDVEVKYTENGSDYESIDSVSVDNDVVRMEGLDHFSIYIVSSILPVKPSPAPVQVETKVSCNITVSEGESIQEAINKSGESGERLTICVKKGVYRGENLIIDHPVRLVALLDDPQTDEAVIIGENKDNPTIHIKGRKNVEINGLTIVESNSEKGGILVEDSSECLFINNRFLNNQTGLTLKGGEENKIEKNIFENNQKQITIEPLDNDMLLKTILQRNNFDGSIIVRSQTRSSSTIISTIFGTIQAAVDSANDNDTLDIYDETYNENVEINKPLTLRGVENGPVIHGGFMFDTAGLINIENLEFEVPKSNPVDSIHIDDVDKLYVEDSNFNGSGLFVSGSVRGIMSDDSDATVTVQNSDFENGYYTALQGKYEQLDVVDTTISNCKSGINFQGGNNLDVKNTNISVIAQGDDNDTYAVRFASSSAGSGHNMILDGGTYLVDKNDYNADSGIYHSAIVVRSGANGELKANNLSLNGDVVNLSEMQLDATYNWWGDMSGPYHTTNNPRGSGYSAIGDVELCPWLDEEDGDLVGPCLGEIQGRKYEDLNQNTWMNNGEPGIQDWTINLYNDSWTLIDSMVTGDDTVVRGNVDNDQYRFEDLLPGTYYVCEARDLSFYQTGPAIGDNPRTKSGSVAHEDAVAVVNESPNTLNEGESCWQVEVTGDDLVGYIKFGNIELEDPNRPEQTGYEDQEGKTYACTNDFTKKPKISIHWIDESIGTTPPDNLLKYQRQYSRDGNSWSGNEIYSNNYTNFRSFGFGEVIHYSRVRSFYDTNMNGQYDAGEPVSDWSDPCDITYDATAPTPPTNLSFETTSGGTLGCSSATKEYTIVATWDPSTDESPITYEYRSYNPTTGWVWNGGNIGNVTEREGSFTVGEGVYGFAVRAKDEAGNYSDWTSTDLVGSCQITYDTTAPLVSDITITKDGNPVTYVKEGDEITITASVIDDLTNVKAVSADFSYNTTYSNRPSPRNTKMYNVGGDMYEATLTIPSGWNEGELYITVAARDILDNYDGNRLLAETLVIDNTKPETKFLSQLGNTFHNTFPISIEGESNDLNNILEVNLYYRESGTTGWTWFAKDSNIGNNLPFEWLVKWTPNSQGVFDIKASATDYAGNVEESPILYGITFDSISPEVEITSHNDGDWIRGSRTIKGYASDANLSHYWFVIQNAVIGNTVAGLNTVHTTSSPSFINYLWNTNSVPDGKYIAKLEARDKAGNKDPNQAPILIDPEVIGDSVDWVTLNVDNTPPTQPVITNSPDNSYTNVNAITINWTGGDDTGLYPSGIKGYILGYEFIPANGGSSTTWDTGLKEVGNSYTHSGTYGHGEGTYIFYVKTVDNTGNESPVSDTFTITYDNTPPDKPTGLHRRNANGDTFVCGAKAQRQTMIPDWDDIDITDDPSFSHFEYSSFHPNGGQGLDEKDLYVSELMNSWTASEDGTYGYAVRSVDKAGNKSDWSLTGESLEDSCQITYDSEAPEVYLTSPEDNYYTNQTVVPQTWDTTATDVAYYEYRSCWNDPTSETCNQIYTTQTTNKTRSVHNNNISFWWQVRGIDDVGNIGDWSTPRKITIDTIFPVVDITNLKDGDIISGDTQILGTIIEENMRNFNLSLNPDPDGLCNKEDTWNFGDRIWGIDGNSNSVDYTFDTNDHNDGSYMIRFAARDLAMNRDPMANSGEGVSVEVVCVTIDNTAPVTTFNEDFTNQYFNSDITILGQSIDTNEVAGVTLSYRLTGETNWTDIILDNNSLSSTYDWTHDWTPPAQGVYDIKASAFDSVGNIENSPTMKNITYDTTKPIIAGHSNMTLTEGETFPTDTVTLTDNYELNQVCATAEDLNPDGLGVSPEFCVDVDSSNLNSNEFSLADEIRKAIEDWQGSPFNTIDLNVLPEGQYEISYYATDLAGNESDTQTFTVTIQNDAPTITIDPTDTEVLEGDDPIVLSTTTTNGNTPFTYQWTGDCTGTGEQTTFDPTTEGEYTCTVTVTDSDGDTSSDSVDIAVGAALGATNESTEDEGGDNTTAPTVFAGQALGVGTGYELTGEDDEEEEEEDDGTTEDEKEVLGEDIISCENPITLQGYLYLDKNKNDQMDDKEKGIADVNIRIYYIYEGNEITVDEITTDEDGYWETEVCPTEYFFEVNKEDLPKHLTVSEVLSLTISEESNDPTEFNISATDTRNFWQKYWYLILIGAALLITTIYLILTRKEKEQPIQ